MRADRPGLTLMEVLVALVLLGLGAVAWTGIAGQSANTLTRVHAREGEMQHASQVMARMSLWPRDELALYMGSGVRFGLRIHVAQLAPALYEVSLADTLGGTELLRTSMYVRDAADVR